MISFRFKKQHSRSSEGSELSKKLRLDEDLETPQYELQFLLKKGELMMFDNNRVLHGRTAFNPSEGRRQLQGCYIDRDAPRSLFRVLTRQKNAKSNA